MGVNITEDEGTSSTIEYTTLPKRSPMKDTGMADR